MYGSRRRVVAEVHRSASRSSQIVWLTGSPDTPHAWQGIRQLLGRVAEVVDRRAFQNVVARHRPIISILYPDLPLELEAAELEAGSELRADWRSHHTHSTASWQPIVRAAADLVAELTEAADAVMAIPELAELDAQTGHAIIEAARVHRSRMLGLHVGHDPELDRARDLIWGIPAGWRVEHVRAQLCDYQLCPGCQTSRLTGHDESDAIIPAAASTWNRPAPDAVALELLGGTRMPSPIELESCVSAMRWCIEAYAFGSAFRIGTRLEPHSSRLERHARADHAAFTAIAATNVHFVDTATPGFDDQLYAMYERAIALATEPVAAVALAVRLAFAAVERDAEAADAYAASAAWHLTQAKTELDLAYHSAWLAIARALDRLHHTDLRAADTYARMACAAFEQATALAPMTLPPRAAARLRREASCARFSVLAHCAIHGSRMRDEIALEWLAQAEAERPNVPAVLLFESLHWTLLEQFEHDPAAIHERCRAGIEDAERYWNAGSWYVYRAIAADCAYRMGRLADALEHVRDLVRAAWLDSPAASPVGDIRPLALRVFLRAEAYADLSRAAASLLDDHDVTGRADVHAILALAYAARGDHEGQEQSLELAIDHAVAHGNQAVMLRVGIAAVQVLMMSERRDEAKHALENAWDLATNERGEPSSAVRPHDCLHLCLVHTRVLGATGELLARALSLLPRCIDDAESWWHVTELLDLLVAWHRDGHGPPAGAAAALARVRSLAGSREDWQPRLAVLDAFANGQPPNSADAR